MKIIRDFLDFLDIYIMKFSIQHFNFEYPNRISLLSLATSIIVRVAVYASHEFPVHILILRYLL